MKRTLEVTTPFDLEIVMTRFPNAGKSHSYQEELK
jgi:hypothetical protein